MTNEPNHNQNQKDDNIKWSLIIILELIIQIVIRKLQSSIWAYVHVDCQKHISKTLVKLPTNTNFLFLVLFFHFYGKFHQNLVNLLNAYTSKYKYNLIETFQLRITKESIILRWIR